MPLPINDAIIAALAKLIDDSKSPNVHREPTHSEIDFSVGRAGLSHAAPAKQGPVSKAKRVRTILSQALSDDEAAGSKLIEALISKVRSCGGLRDTSSNPVGKEAIENLTVAFDVEGFALSADGTVGPKVLGALRGAEMTAALKAYAARSAKLKTPRSSSARERISWRPPPPMCSRPSMATTRRQARTFKCCWAWRSGSWVWRLVGVRPFGPASGTCLG